jgi:hypothetical protein
MATKVSPATSGGIRNGLKFAGEFSAEWLRINDVTRCFGLSRPALFKLITLGRIRSVHLRREGAEKGIRLVSAQSVRDYITSFEEAAR